MNLGQGKCLKKPFYLHVGSYCPYPSFKTHSPSVKANKALGIKGDKRPI